MRISGSEFIVIENRTSYRNASPEPVGHCPKTNAAVLDPRGVRINGGGLGELSIISGDGRSEFGGFVRC